MLLQGSSRPVVTRSRVATSKQVIDDDTIDLTDPADDLPPILPSAAAAGRGGGTMPAAKRTGARVGAMGVVDLTSARTRSPSAPAAKRRHTEVEVIEVDSDDGSSDGQAGGATRASSAGMMCSVCTYLNSADAINCLLCDTSLLQRQDGSWACDDCTFANDPKSDSCGVCYAPRHRVTTAQLPAPAQSAPPPAPVIAFQPPPQHKKKAKLKKRVHRAAPVLPPPPGLPPAPINPPPPPPAINNPQPQPAAINWSCGTCRRTNHHLRTFCGTCGARPPQQAPPPPATNTGAAPQVFSAASFFNGFFGTGGLFSGAGGAANFNNMLAIGTGSVAVRTLQDLMTKATTTRHFELLVLEAQSAEFIEVANHMNLQSYRKRIKAITKVVRCFQTPRVNGVRRDYEERGLVVAPRPVWHGTDLPAIEAILSKGFAVPPTATNGRSYGHGIYLSPMAMLHQSIGYCRGDTTGTKHLLLCHLYARKTEQLKANGTSWQVEDPEAEAAESSAMLVVFQAHCNTALLPMYIVSFK